MLRFFKFTFCSALLFFISLNGQAQEDGWLKKNWKNMVAHFNAYYHAEVKVKQGFEDLRLGNQYDFSAVIDILPYYNSQMANANKGQVDVVLKKLSKVINNRGKDNSKWVRRSYFMMAEAYLLKHDFYSAEETYQYVITRYPKMPIHFDAQLGVLKTYILQKKYLDAEALLGIIKGQKDFPKTKNKELNMLAAELYAKEGKYSQAIEPLEMAIASTKDRIDLYRFRYALGQMYLLTDQSNKALAQFEKVIKSNAPYEFVFQANINLANSLDLSKSKDLAKARRYLNRMLKDDKNIEYFDQIFYRMGKLEQKSGNLEQALSFYKLSKESKASNSGQIYQTYLAIAELYEQSKQYDLASIYYDSASIKLNKEVVLYEEQIIFLSNKALLNHALHDVFYSDSVIELSKLPKDVVLERIKKQETSHSKSPKKKSKYVSNKNIQETKSVNNVSNFGQTGGSNWYFYNAAAVGRGSNDFIRKFGERPLADWWRLSSKIDKSQFKSFEEKQQEEIGSENNEKNIENTVGIQAETDDVFKDIPYSQERRDLLAEQIKLAALKAATYYKDNFNDCNKAIDLLSFVQNKYGNPQPIKDFYALMVNCGDETKNQSLKNEYLSNLEEEFPGDPILAYLKGESNENQLNESSAELEKAYEKCYNLFENNQNKESLQEIEKALAKYPGSELQAKFELLKAMNIAKTKGKEAYKIALNEILELYPSSQEAIAANEFLMFLNQNALKDNRDNKGIYVFEPNLSHSYMLIFKDGDLNKIKSELTDFNQKNYPESELKVKNYFHNQTKQNLILVNDFSSKDDAESYFVNIITKPEIFEISKIVDYKNCFISKNNFKKLFLQPNTDGYIEFFQNTYIK